MTVVPPVDDGPGWEYLYFAAELARGLADHEAEYLEYQSQVAAPKGPTVTDPVAHLRTLTGEISNVVAQIPLALSPSALERAFGLPGHPGDETAIRSVAGQLTEVYAELITWGLRVRSTVVEEKWLPVFAALAKYVSLPLHQFQDFSAALSARTSQVITDVRAGGVPPSEPISLALNVSIDPAAASEFDAALAALKSSAAAAPPAAAQTQGFAHLYPPAPPFKAPATGMPAGSPLERAKQLPRWEWFRRFGDIPGVAYQTPAGIDPTKLPGYGLVPRRTSSDFGGGHLEDLMWTQGEESTSASPAHEWGFGPGSADSVAAVVKWCAEGLELPGEPSDYHFMIQGAIGKLHSLRRKDHSAFPELEHLCLLDLALLEAWPRAVMDDYSDVPHFYACEAFDHLISLYATEGALHEAMEMAQRAASFSPGWDRNKTAAQGLVEAHDKRDELAERIAAVDAETKG